MESEIVRYVNEMEQILRRMLDDSIFYNAALHFYTQDSLKKQIYLKTGQESDERLIGFDDLCVALIESFARISDRRKEIAEVTPPDEAKSHHLKLSTACQKKQQALEEYLTYVEESLKHGAGERHHLQRFNELLRENSQLLEEANIELKRLGKEIGRL